MKLQQNQLEKAVIVLSQLSQKTKNLQDILLFAIIIVLPFQLGKHFWPSFAFVAGQRVDYLSPTLYVSDVLIILLFTTMLFRGRKTEDREQMVDTTERQKSVQSVFSAISHPYSVISPLAIILFLSIGIFFSKSPLNGWYSLLKLLEFVFFGWVVASYSKSITSKLFYSFSIGVFVEGILGILQFLHHGSINGFWYFLGERAFNSATPGIANASIHGQLILRPYGTFPHPNVFAGYLVIILLFFLTRIFKTKDKLQKIFSIILLIFGFIVILLTLSRVAITVFCALVLFYVAWNFMKLKNRILIVSCILFFGIFLVFPLLSGRFLDIQGYAESFQLRDVLNQSALQMFISHSLLGVGLGNFLPSLAHRSFSEGGTLGIKFLQPVHNIFLLVLAETGIIGFGIFLFTLLMAFKKNILLSPSRFPLHAFPFLSLLAICLIGLTDHYFLTLQQGQLLLVLILGIAFSSK